MDYDSSTKFISSLAKFLQSLCNGYVEFDNGVEVIGHIYLSVDTGKKIDYILNEKVCKTDENSVTFISNSFHAQPAEKPKPSSKRNRDTNESVKSPDDRQTLDNGSVNEIEPKSTNFGTIPRSQNQGSKGSSSLSSQKQLKRPASPGITGKGGHSSPSHKKNRSGDIHDPNVLDSNSAISTSSPGDLDEGTLHSAQGVESNVDGNYSETYQETFFHPGEEESLAGDSEDRDIKPSIDTDVTFVKEEFAPSSQIGGQDNDRTRDDSSTYSGMYHSNQPYSTMPGYSNQSSFGAHNSQRLNYGATGDRSDIYDSSQGSHLEGVEGSADPTALMESLLKQPKPFPTLPVLHSSRESALRPGFLFGRGGGHGPTSSLYGRYQLAHLGKRYTCSKCSQSFSYPGNLTRHRKACEGNFDIKCMFCDKVFYRQDVLKMHLRRKHGVADFRTP